MQKLLGKIFHACKCTQSARAFLARILELLRQAAHKNIVPITEGAKKDACWLMSYLQRFNGITMIKPTEVVVEVDSCLKGTGGICMGMGYYCLVYPRYLQEMGFAISCLECLNLLIVIRFWCKEWRGMHVLVYCDGHEFC